LHIIFYDVSVCKPFAVDAALGYKQQFSQRNQQQQPPATTAAAKSAIRTAVVQSTIQRAAN
jgi:hypothetical protein